MFASFLFAYTWLNNPVYAKIIMSYNPVLVYFIWHFSFLLWFSSTDKLINSFIKTYACSHSVQVKSEKDLFTTGCCDSWMMIRLKSPHIVYMNYHISSRWCEVYIKRERGNYLLTLYIRYPLRPPVNISDSPTPNCVYNKVYMQKCARPVTHCHSLVKN